MMLKFLSDIKNPKVKNVGGKAYSLIILTNKGFNVPKGFVINSDIFFEYLNENNLFNKIKKISSHINKNNFQKSSNEIRNLIIEGEFPKEIEQQIKNNLTKLNIRYVSIRSSAVSEDSISASFAGLHNSYLNIKIDIDLVIKYIKKCWESLFTDRAVIYRIKKNIPQFEGMSVIIQKMIPAEISGTTFTVHPDTYDNNTMIIECSWGLGTSIVSGYVTPDRYIVDKNNLELIDQKIGRKKIYIVQDKNILLKRSTPLYKINTYCLDRYMINQLTRISIEIEKTFDYPQDIEWCIYRDRIWILQSRAITSLK